MKRFLIASAVFAAALTVSVLLGHRLGWQTGESVVRERMTVAAASLVTPANAARPGFRPASLVMKGPLGREGMTRFLDELNGLSWQSDADGSALRAKLATLSPEEVQLALDLILERPPGAERARLSMALLSRWTEEDPPAALAYVRAHREEAGPFAALWLTAILPRWADRDPGTAARAMVSTLRADEDDIMAGSIGNTVFMVAEKLAQVDLAAGLEHVAALPEWARDPARSAVAKQVHGDGRQRFLDAIEVMPRGEQKTAWQRAAATAMAPVDAAAASQWIDSLALPAAELAETNHAVFSNWKSHDPRAAAAWAMSRLPEAEHAGIIEQTVESWASREPNECGRWLGEFGSGPLLDRAIGSFARQVASKDPESARVWAGRITDVSLRTQCLGEIGGAH